jgi:hypothetical protein
MPVQRTALDPGFAEMTTGVWRTGCAGCATRQKWADGAAKWRQKPDAHPALCASYSKASSGHRRPTSGAKPQGTTRPRAPVHSDNTRRAHPAEAGIRVCPGEMTTAAEPRGRSRDGCALLWQAQHVVGCLTSVAILRMFDEEALRSGMVSAPDYNCFAVARGRLRDRCPPG